MFYTIEMKTFVSLILLNFFFRNTISELIGGGGPNPGEVDKWAPERIQEVFLRGTAPNGIALSVKICVGEGQWVSERKCCRVKCGETRGIDKEQRCHLSSRMAMQSDFHHPSDLWSRECEKIDHASFVHVQVFTDEDEEHLNQSNNYGKFRISSVKLKTEYRAEYEATFPFQEQDLGRESRGTPWAEAKVTKPSSQAGGSGGTGTGTGNKNCPNAHQSNGFCPAKDMRIVRKTGEIHNYSCAPGCKYVTNLEVFEEGNGFWCTHGPNPKPKLEYCCTWWKVLDNHGREVMKKCPRHLINKPGVFGQPIQHPLAPEGSFVQLFDQ